jgi:phage pi2 protein 07
MNEKTENREKYILRRMQEDREQVEKILQKQKSNKALDVQVGGNHYKDCKIQPVEYIYSNKLDFLEGNVVKYITRHRTKGDGEADIRKVIHYAQMILQMEYNKGE